MKFLFSIGILILSVAFVPQANADFLDRLLDGVIDRAEKKAEERANEAAEDVVDSTFNKSEEAVDCALSDRECNQEEKAQQPQKSPVVNAESPSATMKCVVTDVTCLKEAQTLGKQVEIINEEDLDKLRCTVTDVACLKKAQQLGKQVEIID